jgi:hypothetical protein
MCQVLSDQHVANVLPVDSQITASAPEVACARALGTGPARAIHNLQIDISAELDHLPEPRRGPSGEHAFKSAMSVASQLGSVKIDQADSLTVHVDRVTVDHVNISRGQRIAGSS